MAVQVLQVGAETLNFRSRNDQFLAGECIFRNQPQLVLVVSDFHGRPLIRSTDSTLDLPAVFSKVGDYHRAITAGSTRLEN